MSKIMGAFSFLDYCFWEDLLNSIWRSSKDALCIQNKPLICIHLPTRSVSLFFLIPENSIISFSSWKSGSYPSCLQFPANSHWVPHQILPVLPSNPILYLPVPLYLHPSLFLQVNDFVPLNLSVHVIISHSASRCGSCVSAFKKYKSKHHLRINLQKSRCI